MSLNDDDTKAKLVGWFEASEEASSPARVKAERDVDYFDGKQLTEAEYKELKDRGQPPIVINLIKRKIDFLIGMEAKQRSDPKAQPRTPADDDGAEVATDALRYIADANDYHQTRAKIWKDILVPGWGGGQVTVAKARKPDRIASAFGMEANPDIKIKRTAWDRMFWDAYSSEPDFSDCRHRGLAIWMDEPDALSKYKDNKNSKQIIASTLSAGRSGETFDDKPRKIWVDSKRKRVRIIQMWWKENDRVFWAELTNAGILAGGESPYAQDDDEPCDPFVWHSAYVDRDNNRYGLVRDMIDPQDEVNKRRSKSLHLLTMRQVKYETGAVEDIEKAKRQMARPDGAVEVAPGLSFEVLDNQDLTQGQMELLRHATAELEKMGPNEALQGAGNATSGRDRQAQQAGGMVELGGHLDGLRSLDKRTYRLSWAHAKKFCKAPWFIRVTDREDAAQFVGLNEPMIDPQTGMAVIDGQTGQMAMRRQTAEMDMDIVIEEAPDVASIEQEVWQDLSQLIPMLAQLPPMWAKIAIEASPLPPTRKRRLIGMLEQPQEQSPEQQQAAQKAAALQEAGITAEIGGKQADARLKIAKAAQAEAETARGPEGPAPITPLDMAKAEETRARAQAVLAGIPKAHAETRHTNAKTLETVRNALTPPPHLIKQPESQGAV